MVSRCWKKSLKHDGQYEVNIDVQHHLESLLTVFCNDAFLERIILNALVFSDNFLDLLLLLLPNGLLMLLEEWVLYRAGVVHGAPTCRDLKVRGNEAVTYL